MSIAKAIANRARKNETPRKGARGPERDHATDRRVLEIRAMLQHWEFAATAPQIAAVLSFERGELVTADAVRARLRWHKGAK